jgi:hypothetical protein
MDKDQPKLGANFKVDADRPLTLEDGQFLEITQLTEKMIQLGLRELVIKRDA